MRLVYDCSLPDLVTLFSRWGEPQYRARQVWNGLYQSKWLRAEEFTVLPAPLRQRLAEHLQFNPLTPLATQSSHDGRTTKVLFVPQSGPGFEAVLMSSVSRTAAAPDRHTLCVSTQIGCGMGCVFCATGQMGFKRHLTPGEIVAQVLFFAARLARQDDHLTNIVFMGMGEPFHNFENTMQAIDRLNDATGFNFGARRMTISTAGLAPMIERFADENRQVNLSVSLHASDDVTRSTLLPINRRYPLSHLLKSCRLYIQKTSRRITFEWALIQGVNDSELQAEKLVHLLDGLLAHVNVLLLNPTTAFAGRASTHRQAIRFCDTLRRSGIPCTFRTPRGLEIRAGCGQLATSVE